MVDKFTLESVLQIHKPVFAYLERFSETKYWRIKLALFCFLLVFFVAFPYVEFIENMDEYSTWKVVMKQVENPVGDLGVENPRHHDAKRTFRIFVPTLAKISNVTSPAIIYFFQLFLSIIFFYLSSLLSEKLTKDKSASILITVGFAFIYLGQVGIVDLYARFDSIAVLCLLGALVTRNPGLIFFLSLAAAFTDERAFIALPMLFVFLKTIEYNQITIKSLFIPDIKSISVIFAMIAYLVLRLYLQHEYGLKASAGMIGLSVMFSQTNMFLFGIWSGFEGFWIIVIICLLILLLKKEFFLFFIFIIVSTPSILVSLMVIDITRSLIYCFPLLFLSLNILTKLVNSNFYSIRKLLYFCLLISAIVPTYEAFGSFRIKANNPFIIKFADRLVDYINYIF